MHYSGSLAAQRVDFDRVQFRSASTEPSFNSGVVWKATEMDTFRLTLARGVQLPTLVEQGIQLDPFTAGPTGIYGRPNLLPSITWNAEAGLRPRRAGDRVDPAHGFVRAAHR